MAVSRSLVSPALVRLSLEQVFLCQSMICLIVPFTHPLYDLQEICCLHKFLLMAICCWIYTLWSGSSSVVYNLQLHLQRGWRQFVMQNPTDPFSLITQLFSVNFHYISPPLRTSLYTGYSSILLWVHTSTSSKI